ncbi:Poly(A) RNA polymerase, mitochondrial [Melipona quadrifasciata]|uniref:Poly(A) RNA polymerase, mitochondrial n=1 Tax=Melipona quadrifasciata TaxID=166423 RepID=A0A0N0U732_9HYME|nr:Poly(A) RNA polymerase, mitochondrial [Melipona quadrifasciata]
MSKAESSRFIYTPELKGSPVCHLKYPIINNAALSTRFRFLQRDKSFSLFLQNNESNVRETKRVKKTIERITSSRSTEVRRNHQFDLPRGSGSFIISTSGSMRDSSNSVGNAFSPATRQTEAKKSVIIKISEVSHIEHLKHFCECYARIVNIFPYNTIDNNRFVLMECSSEKDVEALRKIAVCKADPEYAHCVTPFFLYKPRFKLHTNQKTLDKDNYEYYSNFETPKLNEINQSLKKIQSVSNQMMFLYNKLRITELNIRLRFYTATQISYYLSQLFINLSVVPFGSSVNGFGQIGCDLDLLCKTNISSDDKSGWKKFLFMTQIIPLVDRNEQKHFLDVIGTIMRTCIPGITDVKKILEARVPIIKFRNLYTNMQCDLSSTNMTALHMSELLYLYGQLDWRVKPLVFTIRKWARSMNLTKENPGHWITNFSLTLLILFYLQTKDILPSLTSIKIFSNKSNSIDNSDWFLKWKNSVSNNDESLSKLLREFFEYYSFFDFKTQALCLRDGITKVKKDVSPLYIYNPFNPSLNFSFYGQHLLPHFDHPGWIPLGKKAL